VFDCWKLAAGANAIDRDAPAVERLCAIVEQLCGLVAPLAKGSAGPQVQPDPAALAAGLAKLAEAIVPRLDALQKRVEDIAATPLPPQAAARGFALPGVSKREDGGGALFSGDDIAAALARMTDEERTLTLIKAAHANPINSFASPSRD